MLNRTCKGEIKFESGERGRWSTKGLTNLAQEWKDSKLEELIYPLHGSEPKISH
jgi:hypothetical protein